MKLLKFLWLLVTMLILLVQPVDETSNGVKWENGTCTFLGKTSITLKDGTGGVYTSTDLCKKTEWYNSEDLQCKKCPDDRSNCCRNAMSFCEHQKSDCELLYPQPTTNNAANPSLQRSGAQVVVVLVLYIIAYACICG